MKKKIIAFIPARGGSKSIKNKNLKKLGKKSLVEITIDQAIKSKLFSKTILSSDSKNILKVGKKYKKIEIFKRPPGISKDISKTELAILHYLKNNQNYSAEYLVILQVTSPLRKIKTLKKFVSHCISKKIKNCLTVTYKKDHISKYQIFFDPLEKINFRRRQDRKGFLIENGMLYFLNIKEFLKRKTIYSKKWNYFITEEYESIDINNVRDLEIVKKIYKNV